MGEIASTPTPEELRYLESVLGKYFAPPTYQVYLLRQLRRWYKFVLDVERGYTLTIFEYHNSLDGRDILQEVIDGAPPSLHERLDRAVSAWDRRYDEATRPMDRPLRDTVPPGQQRHAWWYRIPKKLEDRLAADLRDDGLLDHM